MFILDRYKSKLNLITMSTQKYLSIKESAEISGKSVQTIRRMIKAKKLKFRKERTPQGFNYLIDSEAFYEFFGIAAPAEQASATQEENIEVQTVEATIKAETEEVVAEQAEETEEVAVVAADRKHQKIVNYEPVKEFNETIQKIVDQHGKEKENLFKLIESFQNKVIHLETKLKETSPKKKLFKLW